MPATSNPETLHRSLALPWDLRAARAARASVREVLGGWGYLDADHAYTAALVVSELVTNVVQHAGDPDQELRVDVHVDAGHRLRIAVTDGSAIDPVVRELDDTATSGRGMHLVSELVDDWGVERLPDGKSVWVELDLLRRTSS